jgi:hypothetical protein
MLSTFLVSPLKIPYPLPHLPAPQSTHSHSWPWHFPILGHRTFTGPRVSLPIDDWLGHPLLHMRLEPPVPSCVFFDWWFSPKELWGLLVCSYCCSSYGAANPFSSFGPLSSSFNGDLVLSPMVGWEHPPLYSSGTGRASQKTAIVVSCQQALLGIHNSFCVWWLYMGWIPRWGSLLRLRTSIRASQKQLSA